jgi:hypothetical protein
VYYIYYVEKTEWCGSGKTIYWFRNIAPYFSTMAYHMILFMYSNYYRDLKFPATDSTLSLGLLPLRAVVESVPIIATE